ncbi:hypothetical protein M408DRAFT_143185 [Serendipita vermifera MAFF 305830]|uniref:Uncharacterized protein n=1 Tax=Serendipita vermifera MAFF 305830 TaxID=933852 RepID=A0A0C3ALZ0_SERVB|nr:hypothetical protein M408DRAFT_143185 [Serendipita vermifera MAFF 305830]
MPNVLGTGRSNDLSLFKVLVPLIRMDGPGPGDARVGLIKDASRSCAHRLSARALLSHSG